jgi:threonyl-tRNA synthetase
LTDEQLKRGYVSVDTPHIYKVDLWKTSGHYDNYRENMYFTRIDDVEYGIKPMNCPGHIMIYKTKVRSYRELPLRLFEFGTVYRHELSGVLSGLFRVRGFTQDDAHIFVRPDQIRDEAHKVMDFALFVLKSAGFNDLLITLSTKPAKAIGSEEGWKNATRALEDVLKKLGLKYDVDEGGGAFYGPKIDVKIRDSLGRLWQCSTLQVDFNLPERFDVNYVGEDGHKHRAVMLHRALFGSVERFIGVLLEHYGGALPLWLSPVQVAILPVADSHNVFARELASRLEAAGLRVEVDASQNKTGFKIREAQLQKIPLMLVVGDKEKEGGVLAVRYRDGKVVEGVPVEKFISGALSDVESRK